MAIPTSGEEFSKLIEYLRKAQESAAMLSHLHGMANEKTMSLGWLTVSEGLKRQQKLVTDLATSRKH